MQVFMKMYCMQKDKQVLFIVPYPEGLAPSQRFRVEQYFPLLKEQQIGYTLRPFLDEAAWNILYKGGAAWKKAWSVVKGFLKRAYTVLFEAPAYNTIFIHREAAPLGPPIFEWWLTKVWKKKLVYDFDDAIWIPNTSEENKMAARLKAFWKVAKICKWSAVVAAGNDFLAAYAVKSGATDVQVLPTVVDTDNRYLPLAKPAADLPIIGWTGSHSTLKYLDELVPVLQTLEKEIDFCFLVIADKDPLLPLKNYGFIKWNAATEIEDLNKLDIGVMPLTADAWSEGKCGFKLIQYEAMAIPALATAIGVNSSIIDDGTNGFLCNRPEQWMDALLLLLQDARLRQTFGKAGREKMIAEYSLRSQSERFLKLVAPQQF